MFTADADRQLWTAVGGPEPQASNGRYFVFDRERNVGVIAGADNQGGYIAPPMPGTEGDRVLVYYTDVNGQESTVACLILNEQRPWAPVCPNP